MKKRKFKVWMLTYCLFFVLLLSGLKKEEACRLICDTYIPMISFINQTRQTEKTKMGKLGFVMNQILVYRYITEHMGYEVATEDAATYELIIKSEANDENRVDENGVVIASEGDVGIQETLSENTKTTNAQEKPSMPAAAEFIKASQKSKQYELSQYASFEELIKEFYVVDKTTLVDEEQLNAEKLMSKDMSLQTQNDKPQILIYHTHSQEGFADSILGVESQTVVGAGETLSEILRHEYGYNVLHDRGHYDVKSRDYAYSEAAPAIEKILTENPSIEVVIDLHRDGVNGDTKLVSDLNGRPTAQFMFFNGLSKTKSRGAISYLENPYIEDNLAFSFQMQVKSNEYYPGITRKIYLKGYRYNMHYRAKSLLIELGAQTNTVEEIKNACDPIAHVLHMVLSKEEP